MMSVLLRMRIARAVGTVLLSIPLAWPAIAAECDLAAGAKLFREQQCLGCHTFASDDFEKSGPNLHGVVGRKAGTAQFAAYSDALKASGLVWTPDNLKKWVANPGALVPGTTMPFIGLPDETERNTLVCYIEQKSK